MGALGELGQLQAPLRRMTAQSRFKHERIMRLKRELREAKEEVRSTDDIYRQHLLYYARKDCLQLANMMHQKLPIELRELVYGFLCVEPDRPIPVGPYYHFRKYDQPFHDPQLRIPWPDDELLRSTWPPQRVADPNSYAAYIRAGGEVEVEIGDASGTQEHSDGSQHAEPFRLVDSNDTQMAPELTRLIMKTSISTPADRVKLHDDPDDTILPDGRVKEEHTHKPPSDMVLPYSHFLDPRYVGPAIAFETQKMYYAQNTFSVCSVEQGIFYLLNSDSSKNMVGRRYDGRPKYVPKDLELKPPVYPRDHIQNLQIRVKLEQFHSDMPQDHFSDFEKYAYERRFLRFTQQNLEGLKGFLHNRSKQRLNIEFVIMTELLDFEEDDPGWHAKCNYVNFLQSIRNWVYRMMYDCGNVSVKITHHDELQFPFPRDITGLFGLTKEQWEHEKAANQDEHDDWVGQFYLAVPGMDRDDISFGYPAGEVDSMLRERWGVDSVLATRSTRPVIEGRYWPTSITRVHLDS